jgi:RNase P subunit RPR2
MAPQVTKVPALGVVECAIRQSRDQAPRSRPRFGLAWPVIGAAGMSQAARPMTTAKSGSQMERENIANVRKLMLCWRCNGPAKLTGVRVRLAAEGGGHEASYRCEDCGVILKRTIV